MLAFDFAFSTHSCDKKRFHYLRFRSIATLGQSKLRAGFSHLCALVTISCNDDVISNAQSIHRC